MLLIDAKGYWKSGNGYEAKICLKGKIFIWDTIKKKKMQDRHISTQRKSITNINNAFKIKCLYKL